MGDNDKEADLLQGTLELLILRTLAAGEKHGYEIAEWIDAGSAEALSADEGAMYPALPPLALCALLSADGDVFRRSRRATRQRLSATGRKRLNYTANS